MLSKCTRHSSPAAILFLASDKSSDTAGWKAEHSAPMCSEIASPPRSSFLLKNQLSIAWDFLKSESCIVALMPRT